MTQTIPVGIDLGTTFSAVAYINAHEQPTIIKNSDGDPTTPSVIFIDDGEVIVGAEAKERQAVGEENIACFFKRYMGDTQYQLYLDGRDYTPVELSTLVLNKLKADAEAELGHKITDAVITVPAYFNDMQRKATIQAGKAAGLNVLQIVNEPTAAAIAYGLKQGQQEQTVLVYDLGGGTFDVTLIRIKKDSFEVLATDGDHQLGGKDWDDRVANYLAQQFLEEYQQDPLDNSEAYNDLLVRCENAKRQLSLRSQTQLTITHGGAKGSYTLTREQFEQITDDLMQRTRQLCEQVLQDARLNWANVDYTVLVGGSTRMPMVASFIQKMTGKAPIKGVNPDEAVAMGAAILASANAASTQDVMEAPMFTLGAAKIQIQDVMSHSLGMVATNADRSKYINSIIIPKNQLIPSIQSRPFQLRTSSRRDNVLEAYMLQGENERPLDCNVLGKYVFSDIEHIKGGPAIIDVEYAYDRNGVIKVSATQKQVNKPLKLTIEPVPDDLSWLDLPPEEEVSLAHLSVILAIDLSGSMSGEPLRKAQKASKNFVAQFDLSNTSLGLITFADQVRISQGFTQSAKALNQGISQWTIGDVGIGNDTDPFMEALTMLREREDPRFIVVLTDGVWYEQSLAIERAKACANEDIEIIAIGFGSADEAFLKEIATSDEQALMTDLSSLNDSFSRIAQVLTESGGGMQYTNDNETQQTRNRLKFWS